VNFVALIFDGANDYVNVGNSSSLKVSPLHFTVEAWMKRDSLNNRDCIWASGTGNNTSIYYQQVAFYLEDSGNGSQISCKGGSSYSNTTLNFDAKGQEQYIWTSIQDSLWHHVAVVDGYQLYVDGVGGSCGNYGQYPITQGIVDRRIGSFAAGANYFHGTIDDVRLYNRAVKP
jgi:hypothetical protein